MDAGLKHAARGTGGAARNATRQRETADAARRGRRCWVSSPIANSAARSRRFCLCLDGPGWGRAALSDRRADGANRGGFDAGRRRAGRGSRSDHRGHDPHGVWRFAGVPLHRPLGPTTAGSRTTSLGSTTSPLAASFWLRATPLGRRSRVVASYRPVSTVLYFSRLLREKFAGTPYAKYFLDGEL
jgi:hypothetical protein